MKKTSIIPVADAAPQKDFALIDETLLKSRIHTIRGVKVMLDADLAEIYGYTTKRFFKALSLSSTWTRLPLSQALPPQSHGCT